MSSDHKSAKIIVILGPTASGKTGLAVALAQKFNGEIISADSRQVYRGMDIGSGKDLADYGDVPYYLIDVANPNDNFTVGDFVVQANQAISEIVERGNLPIVCGGSGLYLQALVDGYNLSGASVSDLQQREDLENLSLAELQNRLQILNPKFFSELNNSDANNKRRLSRYLEILQTAKSLPQKTKPNFACLLLGFHPPAEILTERITARCDKRLQEEDMIGEVTRLNNEGVSWKRLESFGLEYKFIAYYLQGKLDEEQLREQIIKASVQFAKKQMTWFERWEKQGTEINWVDSFKEADRLIENFLF